MRASWCEEGKEERRGVTKEVNAPVGRKEKRKKTSQVTGRARGGEGGKKRRKEGNRN